MCRTFAHSYLKLTAWKTFRIIERHFVPLVLAQATFTCSCVLHDWRKPQNYACNYLGQILTSSKVRNTWPSQDACSSNSIRIVSVSNLAHGADRQVAVILGLRIDYRSQDNTQHRLSPFLPNPFLFIIPSPLNSVYKLSKT
jgi:hypothetical protein